MKKEIIELLVKTDQLRRRSLDKERVKSMLESAMTNMSIVKTVTLTEQSAILIFRETYESVRQLGDALWWTLGYEPRNHEVSMEALKETDITEKVRLHHLSRFKTIRNDANYRGFKVTVAQAKEIVEFWDKCSQEIIALVKQKLK
ncbi:hypothetical protein HY494_01630 [Candidatus Woesearchaeota archaeon]|nr:hypothetical protein [Candidatus Woesearchaeota archaeon]